MSSLNDYEIIKRLGEGSFSNVYLVKNKQNNLIYALKKVEISKLNPIARENSLNEIRILASINHENIISFVDSFYTNNENNQNYLNIILEYADDGDLESKIKNQKKIKKYFDEKLIWSIFIQIVFGLNALHKKNIMHRDLKSANIFLMKNGKIKLGDLNVAKVIQDKGVLRTQTGTPYYASPEIWEDKPYSKKSDIWSIGIILYQMAALKMPFNGKSINEVYYNLSRVKMQELPNIYTENLSLMIKKLLKVDPNERPSCDEILEDKIIKDKIRELFNYNKNDDMQKNEKGDEKINVNDFNIKNIKRNNNSETNIDNISKKEEKNNNLLIFKKYDNSANAHLDNIDYLYYKENNNDLTSNFRTDTRNRNNKIISENEKSKSLSLEKNKAPVSINQKQKNKYIHKIATNNIKSNNKKNYSHILITANDKNINTKNNQNIPRSCLSAQTRITAKINNENKTKLFNFTKKKNPLKINTNNIVNDINNKNNDAKEIKKNKKHSLSINCHKKLNDNVSSIDKTNSPSPSPIPNDNYDLTKNKYIVNSFLNDNRIEKKNTKSNLNNIKRQKININKISSLKKILKPSVTELYTLNDFSSFNNNNNNSNIYKNVNLETESNKKNQYLSDIIINNYRNKKFPLEKIKNNYCIKKGFSCRDSNSRKKLKSGLCLPIIKTRINEHLSDDNIEKKEEIEPTKKMLINPIKIIERRNKLNLHSINLQIKVNMNSNGNTAYHPSSTRDMTNKN